MRPLVVPMLALTFLVAPSYGSVPEADVTRATGRGEGGQRRHGCRSTKTCEKSTACGMRIHRSMLSQLNCVRKIIWQSRNTAVVPPVCANYATVAVAELSTMESGCL